MSIVQSIAFRLFEAFSKTATGQRPSLGTRVVLTGHYNIPRLHSARLLSGVPVIYPLRQNTDSCGSRVRFNFAVCIVDWSCQTREVVAASLQVFVACGISGKCGLQCKLGTQQRSLDRATPVVSRTKRFALTRRGAADGRPVALSHIGGDQRRFAHLARRSVCESATCVSDSIAADILQDYQVGVQAIGADQRCRRQTFRCRLAPHVPVREEPGQESVGLQGAAH